MKFEFGPEGDDPRDVVPGLLTGEFRILYKSPRYPDLQERVVKEIQLVGIHHKVELAVAMGAKKDALLPELIEQDQTLPDRFNIVNCSGRALVKPNEADAPIYVAVHNFVVVSPVPTC